MVLSQTCCFLEHFKASEWIYTSNVYNTVSQPGFLKHKMCVASSNSFLGGGPCNDAEIVENKTNLTITLKPSLG